jgi:hypothetical protein
MDVFTAKQIYEQVREYGWQEFCNNNQILITHAKNNRGFETLDEDIFLDRYDGPFVKDKQFPLIKKSERAGVSSDAIFKIKKRFPKQFKACIIMNLGNKSTLHQRNNNNNHVMNAGNYEINMDITDMSRDEVYEIYKDFVINPENQDKKVSIIWAPTTKKGKEYFIKKGDIQCVVVEDNKENELFFEWVETFCCKRRIMEDYENSPLLQPNFCEFPLLISRSMISTDTTYIDFLICMSNTQFQNRKHILMVFDND